jgi:hypothetical protein
VYNNMKERQMFRDFKQFIHREPNQNTKENLHKLKQQEEKLASSSSNTKCIQFFQKLKRTCKLFVGRHDFCSFIDGGLPNKGTQYVREVLSYQNTGEVVTSTAATNTANTVNDTANTTIANTTTANTTTAATTTTTTTTTSPTPASKYFLKLKISVGKRSSGLIERIVGTTIAIMRDDLSMDVVHSALHEPPKQSNPATFSHESSGNKAPSNELTGKERKKKRPKHTKRSKKSVEATKTHQSPTNKPPLLVNLPKIPLPIQYISKLYMDHINGSNAYSVYDSIICIQSRNIEEKLIVDTNYAAATQQYLNSDTYRLGCEHVKLQIANAAAAKHLQFVNVQLSVSPPPTSYTKVLTLLREIDRNGTWPRTSTNRSKVIESNALTENGGEGGSFSMGSLCLMGEQQQQQQHQACNANALFPELLNEVFRLEKLLCPHRSGSSTVAVNKHATFLPHVDSGAGAGQGISLIVGMGNYIGGQIVVEGQEHNISYSPLEFDGFQERHWTNPFKGERFSLVWFTPRGCENVKYA